MKSLRSWWIYHKASVYYSPCMFSNVYYSPCMFSKSIDTFIANNAINNMVCCVCAMTALGSNDFIDQAMNHRADSRLAPSQWETALLCNGVSHWLGACLEWGHGSFTPHSQLRLADGYSDIRTGGSCCVLGILSRTSRIYRPMPLWLKGVKNIV